MGVRPQRWALDDTEDDMNEQGVVRTLIGLLTNGTGVTDDDEEFLDQLKEVNTFEHELMMTTNTGLVIRCDDGAEFQLTVVQSKRGSDG
jgi:hypothetical protein